MLSPVKYIRQSLSRKLSLWIVLFAAIIFNIALGIMFTRSLDEIHKEAVNRATQILDNTTLRVNSILERVETATDNTDWLVVRHLDAPDSMFVYSRRMLINNPELNGCSIAFEPYYFKDRGRYFSAYSYNDNGNILTTQEGNLHYEYFYMDWYLMPKLLDSSGWTEPFFDYNPDSIYSKDMIASYFKPIKDENGEYIGTFAVDISLEWLSRTISAVKPYPHSYSMMIGQGGTFFVHPDSTKLFYKTIFTDTFDNPDPDITELGHAMLRGEEGMRQLRMEGKDSYVFYKPLGVTGWSVAIVCPESDIFGGYKMLQRIVVFIVLIGLLLMLLVFSRIVSRELMPLTQLADQTGVIATGHFDQKIAIDGRDDEIGRLSQSFGNMQQSLMKYIDELKQTTASKASIESELKVASDIQLSMLPQLFPPFPERKDIDLYAKMIPAKEVGGDLFDFFLRDEKLFFCVGDVSGKGAPAAMLMAVTHSLFRATSARESDPSVIMRTINETVCLDNRANMFVTLFLGVLDLPTGRLRYCNAGHDYPFAILNQPSAIDCLPNLPVGIIPDMKYAKQEFMLAPGTTLFLYTDGLTEAMNATQEQFGIQRVEEILVSCGEKKMSPRQILESVLVGVHSFVQEADQSDDLTMLALHYTPGEFATILNEKITLNCDLSRIPELNDFMISIAERLVMDETVTSQVRLALEEAVVNVMNYAYPEGRKQFVTVKAMSDGHELRLVVIDAGIPFDPTSKEKADTTLSVEDRPIGGLGIYLIRELMDSINYERVDERNILTMIKNIK
ncbi:MAG: SpoIIE family protein phosphatase [Bacteroidales bacterium]|nr:SpoIIE family protein phosphatase [Bacteroidales bacterium]